MTTKRPFTLFLFATLLTAFLWASAPETQAARSAPTGLSGSYDIGGAFADYSSIAQAVSTLNTQGVSGNVTFRIAPDLYNEQVTIEDFPRDVGAETATVTFKADIAANPPSWEYSGASGSNNWIIQLDGADYITFDNILFSATSPSPHGRIIVFNNVASYNTVKNSSFTGIFGVSSDEGSLIFNIDTDFNAHHKSNTFTNNIFTSGYKGIDLPSSGGKSRSDDAVISNNTFSAQERGAINISGDTVTVTNNEIGSASFSDDRYVGIFADGAGSAVVSGNDLDLQRGDLGIEMVSSNGINNRALVSNNLVALRDTDTGTGFGVAAGIVASNGVLIYHNTVRVISSSAVAVYLDGAGSNDISLRNNILSHAGGGTVLEVVDAASLIESEYNILHTTGSTLVEWLGDDYATLADWQVALEQQFDQHSRSKSVSFVQTVGANDLHLAAPSTNDSDLLAPSVAEVTEDVDGDLRSIYSVYRGADEGQEFLPLADADTASGFYTVGGSTPDFTDLDTAVSELGKRGIRGSVTFRIRSGTYSTHHVLTFERFPEPGARMATSGTVLFRQANLAARPTIRHAATDEFDNYVLKLENVNNVVFSNLDFEATGVGDFGRILHLDGEGVDSIEIDGCTFEGITTATLPDSFYNAAIIYANEPAASTSGQDDTIIRGSTFTNGSFGIYQNSGAAGIGEGERTEIRGNTFSEQSAVALFSDHPIIKVQNNSITSSQPNIIGVELWGTQSVSGFDYTVLDGNKVQVDGAGAVGVKIINGSITDSKLGQIKNNMINARTTALWLDDIGGFGLFHNTLRAQEYPLRFTRARTGNELYNNMLVSPLSNPVLHVEVENTIAESDHNLFYNDGGTIVHDGGTNYLTLLGYQIATGFEANSVRKAVTFADVATGDLHLAGDSVGDTDLGGTPLGPVSSDIDQDVRSTTLPYMGADESTALVAPTAVSLEQIVVVSQPRIAWSVAALLVCLTAGLIRPKTTR